VATLPDHRRPGWTTGRSSCAWTRCWGGPGSRWSPSPITTPGHSAGHRLGRSADPDTAASLGHAPRVGTTAPRVLLVDDNPAMRRALRGLLEDAGIQVIGEAANGLEGIAQAELLQPDVVLMDWRMPQLDGLQATARIRQQLPHVRVVMFSSAEGAGQGDRARQAGASTLVAKGAPPEQLCAAVRAAWRSA
jgi:CheY-like chemotaxis protein